MELDELAVLGSHADAILGLVGGESLKSLTLRSGQEKAHEKSLLKCW